MGCEPIKVQTSGKKARFLPFTHLNCIPLQTDNKKRSMNRIKEFLKAKAITQTEIAYQWDKCFNTVNLYIANKVHHRYPCCIR